MRNRLKDPSTVLAEKLIRELESIGNKKATTTQRAAAEIAAGLGLVVAIPTGGVKLVCNTVGDIADVIRENCSEFASELVGTYSEIKAKCYKNSNPEWVEQALKETSISDSGAIAVFLERIAGGHGKALIKAAQASSHDPKELGDKLLGLMKDNAGKEKKARKRKAKAEVSTALATT
jgi:hypothetical protein